MHTYSKNHEYSFYVYSHSHEFLSQKQSAYSFLSLASINMFLLPLI